jgi:hypothetical protein
LGAARNRNRRDRDAGLMAPRAEALQTAMEGYQVTTMDEAAAQGDILSPGQATST